MPAKPKAEMMARLRKERREAGLEEVRGIWLPREIHQQVREYAARLADEIEC